VAVGFVHPDRVLTKSGARPGDVLVLTKPLGVGLVTTAFKGDQTTAEQIEDSTRWMLRLNRVASELLQEAGASACTDVTGFALLGHSCEMAEKSGVGLRIHADRIPLVTGARELADQWLFPAGTGNNGQAFSSRVAFDPALAEEIQQLLLTPETSGGLLAAVPEERLEGLQKKLQAAGEPLWIIGEVLPPGPALVEVVE
jgi:selenide,water dikinase